MKKLNILNYLDHMNLGLFLIVLFLYQIVFIFQGINWTDEGFYATFYYQIFNDPQVVEYNFMYWLSGLVGGSFVTMFPNLGLLGLRVLGVVVTTFTIGLTYGLLKNFLIRSNLLLGLFMLTIFISNDPKELYYNNLSSLLFILSVYLLFKGTVKKQAYLIFFSGAVVALNVFVRLPNILSFSIAVAIFYYGSLTKTALTGQLKQFLGFFAGFIIAGGSVILIMELIGHLDIFIDAIRLVTSMGESAENTHGVFKLIKLFIVQYSSALIISIIVFLLLIIALKAVDSLKREFKVRIRDSFHFYLLALFICGLVFIRVLDYNSFLYFFSGTCLLCGMLILLNDRSVELKTLVVLGCIMLLIHPFGSDKGLNFAGRYSLWILFPIAVNFIINLKSIANNNIVFFESSRYDLSFSIPPESMRSLKGMMFGVSILVCLFFAYYYPYSDLGNRLNMTYTINSKHMQGIHTSKEKAESINQLLSISAKYVQKDDYVLVYHSFPLYYYITETKPFLPNSWLKLYDSNTLKQKLSTSLQTAKSLPVVIRQQQEDFGDPSIRVLKNNVMNEYLEHYNYKEVWSNKDFRVLISNESTSEKEGNERKSSSIRF